MTTSHHHKKPPPSSESADADDAVDAEIDHRSGHQRRDGARGFWMRAGQPDVKRHGARLGGESDEDEQEGDRTERRRERRGVRTDVGEGLAARMRREQHEPDQDRRGADVGHRCVPLRSASRAAARWRCSTRSKQHRGERHQLPRRPGTSRRSSGGNEEQARQEQREHRGRGPTSQRVFRVADAVATGRQPDAGGRRHEERAERVECEVDAGKGQDCSWMWKVAGRPGREELLSRR